MEFKDIVKEWQEEFPILLKYTPSTLFAQAGIVLIGLRLERDWNDYRIFLEILPLWVPKEKIIHAVFAEETRDEKEFQIFIETRLHDTSLPDYIEAQKLRGVTHIDIKKFELEGAKRRKIIEKAIECVHRQFDSVLQENVGLSDIFRLINDHTSTRGFDRSNPLCWYRLFELKLALAYYFNREDLILKVKHEIEKEASLWTQDIFGVSKEEWRDDLYRRMDDRETLMRQVEMNLALKKISRLKKIHIHDDMDPRNTLLHKFNQLLRPDK